MASELATTRESVARALARLRREGAIEQRGTRVRIVNLDRLQAAAWSS
jgi:CRP-like cAMP-binding protein